MSEEVSPNRESQPNASGPEGLAGDMGISSERAGGFEGVEGTGSAASTRTRRCRTSPTRPARSPTSTGPSVRCSRTR
jgi:hypothetical protein